MDKLKQSFSRSKNDEPEDTTSAGGKLTGQGSHFRSAKDSSGFESTTADSGRDTAESAYDPAAAQGPETGGEKQIGNVDPSTVTSTGGRQPSQAVGQTSTYSSHPLTKGDPTSSVIDPESSDPMTYQKPEASYGGAGVPEGAAGIAASKAFSSTPGKSYPYATHAFHKANSYVTEGMPGSYPTQDQHANRTKDESSSSIPPAGVDASGANNAAIIATAGAAPSPQGPSRTADTSGTAPSTLTSTTSPSERLTEYSEAEKSRGLDSTSVTSDTSQHTMVSKVLGAVGLGSLAGAGAAKAASGKDDSAVNEASEQPTTTTGVSSQSIPEQSGLPSHHRKESIPTTAYPAGPESPRPVAPPVGGTQPLDRTESQDQSKGRDDALGAAAVGGGGALGAGAYAAHDREESQAVTNDTAVPSTATAPSDTTRTGAYTSLPTAQQQGPVSTLPETPPTTTTAEPEKEDHTKRNIAAAGAAGVGAGATGAYAAHEYSQRQAAEEESARRAAEQKELAQQQAAHQRELEQQQKAAQQAAAKEERQHQKEIEKHEKAVAKEEKQHQKELQKEEKKHQKEVEKAEKKHEKEVAAAEKERETQEAMERKKAEQAEEEERRKREKETAAVAGVGVAGAGAGAAYAGPRDDESKEITATYKEPKDGGEVEKKPSLLKRMFKRTRKNKDTGEDEEYEEEGDEDGSHRGAAAASVGGAGAAAGGAAYYASRDSDKPTSTDPTDKSYEAQSGGLQKPSYSPSTKDDPATTSFADTTPQRRTAEKVPYETEPVPATTTSTTGKTTDSSPTAATTTSTERTTEPTTTTSPSTIPPPGQLADTHNPTSDKPIEPVTGLPYDPSKDPAAAKRIEEQRHGAMDLMHEAQKAREERGEGGEFGEGGHGHGDVGDGEKKSFGTRIKEKLHLGGGVAEVDGHEHSHGHHGH